MKPNYPRKLEYWWLKFKKSMSTESTVKKKQGFSKGRARYRSDTCFYVNVRLYRGEYSTRAHVCTCGRCEYNWEGPFHDEYGLDYDGSDYDESDYDESDYVTLIPENARFYITEDNYYSDDKKTRAVEALNDRFCKTGPHCWKSVLMNWRDFDKSLSTFCWIVVEVSLTLTSKSKLL